MLLLAVGLLPISTAADQPLIGHVVKVVDGDTIYVLSVGHNKYKIRLAGIDAPERRQPFGKASTKHLASLAAGKMVHVRSYKSDPDQYELIVGTVFVVGTVFLLDDRDVGLEQVKAGYAWCFRRYQDQQSAEDRERYAEAEKEAREARRGLWEEKNPVPPWEWRDQRPPWEWWHRRESAIISALPFG